MTVVKISQTASTTWVLSSNILLMLLKQSSNVLGHMTHIYSTTGDQEVWLSTCTNWQGNGWWVKPWPEAIKATSKLSWRSSSSQHSTYGSDSLTPFYQLKYPGSLKTPQDFICTWFVFNLKKKSPISTSSEMYKWGIYLYMTKFTSTSVVPGKQQKHRLVHLQCFHQLQKVACL